MASKGQQDVVKIVAPVDKLTETTVSNQATNLGEATLRTPIKIGTPMPRAWAPAWFYSALSWLGQSYYDASNTQQAFNIVLAGANVDPYRRLGATRLFVIVFEREEFLLSIAPDADSDAPLTGDNLKIYPRTDAGILSMYTDLAASDIFPFVTHCYVPGKVGFSPKQQEQLASKLVGYDPASGLRRILLGSAIAQVVPVGEFSQTYNEQVYDESPTIVPLATSLVYDVTTNNTIGAKTFVLPTAYIVDQANPGQFAVNRFGGTNTTQQANHAPKSVDYGQTAVFDNGPGYDATKATNLQQSSSSVVAMESYNFITTVFQNSTAYTTAPVAGGVVTGVSALTFEASQPLEVFAKQRILGFYRDNAWPSSLGYPLIDYQDQNSTFAIADSAAALVPDLVYNPAAPFLSGGNLPNVLAKFAAATYVFPPDELQQMIETAGAFSAAGAPAGLSVATASLDFNMSSKPVAGIADELTVPVTATVTTTPSVAPAPATPVRVPVGGLDHVVDTVPIAAGETAAAPIASASGGPGGAVAAVSRMTSDRVLVPVGQGGNTPSTTPAPPSIVQVELEAFIPIEALAGTGIANIPNNTAFFEQALGDGRRFHANAAENILNLCDAHREPPALTPIDLTIADTGLTLEAGVRYVFSLQGNALAARAEHGAALSATLNLAVPDPKHTYVGAVIASQQPASVRLYPILSLTAPAPTVGSNGIVEGTLYSVDFIYGPKQALITVVDEDQIVVVAGLAVASPEPSDNSVPRDGDLYFGSFTGGAETMTVWAVPVFLPIAPTDLKEASFDGAMTLAAASSGLPAYQLRITDSSLIIFTNINVDTREVGSASSANVYVAGIAINSAPDNLSSEAFATMQFVLGIVRQARIGPAMKYVFVPEVDSVLIGGTRYMLSVITLAELTDDPTQRPYPPNFWPGSRFWQFANRHNPYLDIRYNGDAEDARIAAAQADTAAIATVMRQTQEPLHMYLDTDDMVVWPIVGFPLDTSSQIIDNSRLSAMMSDILVTLNTPIPAAPQAGIGVPESQQVVLPGAASRQNPYAFDVDFASSERAFATESLGGALEATDTVIEPALFQRRKPQVVYGFSVYNSTTGECYLIELVPSDLASPDRLPNPTENATYDPYYVRVVFVQRLKAYNMSIIVPSLAHDQYGYLAQPDTKQAYANLIARTDDFSLGYMWSLADTADSFDSLTFHSVIADNTIGDAQTYVCTNLPYRSVGSLESFAEAFAAGDLGPLTFACRRRNWDATCTLMLATRPPNTHRYLAFGGGDLVPVRLDDNFNVDTRLPAHMYNLANDFSVRQYLAVETISVANVPYVIAAGSQNGAPVFSSFAINGNASGVQVPLSADQVLDFPTEIQVVGQGSTTLIDVTTLGTGLTDTNGFFTPVGDNGELPAPQFKAMPYNNLVYVVRAISDSAALAAVGGLDCRSGLLIDTYVPTSDGHLVLAQGARYKRSGMQFFGDSYTPTTMVDSLDTLDFSSIKGVTYRAPTIFVPIRELDASKGLVADIANFLGQQFWTFIYGEIVAQPGETVNGVLYAQGFNLDGDGKPILSLQKLHFVYDPSAVLFTPNDLTHKYPLNPKQQVLALTNGQMQEGICWRTDHLQDGRTAPHNICAQQKLPDGWYMDRPNIIYSSHNRPVKTAPFGIMTKGLSVHSFISISGGVYNIEESGLSTSLSNDQTGGQLISTVSSVSNMLVSVLFDYDNNDKADLLVYDPALTNKGVVFINGYLGATGYTFSSPDHFDVNDVLPSQVPLLDQVADLYGYDVAFYNTDLSLPRQYWSLTYDGLTAAGLPNYIADVAPAIVDPTFSNRTRSLVLNLENEVRPQAIGVMDTVSSVVSVNLHLQNGVTGSVFVNKKADRDVASIGTNPLGGTSFPLYGLPTKYDFFLFSRDHYYTLDNAWFELIDQGYAMCLVDDGTGTGNKVAKYFVDTDGNYNELYTYVLYSPVGGILESNTFALRVTLAAPPNPAATPAVGETPNNVNVQDLVAQINKSSNVVYAVFGASSPGQPPAYIPIQAVSSPVPAAPIIGAPGSNGYNLNVIGAGRQPVLISQIYSANSAYPIAGSTTIQPVNPKTGKGVPFYGSLSHGLDKQVTLALLQSADKSSYLPRTTTPQTVTGGIYGGNGQGALIGTPFSYAFQGSGAIPPQIASNPSPGTTMKADDGVFYTFNAVTNAVMDSTGRSVTAGGGQFFVDTTDPTNPIVVVVSTPKFTLNGNSYAVNLSTTLSDGVTSRYTLIAGGKSYLFEPGNTQVKVNRTLFTFNPLQGGVYTVTCASLDAPLTNDAPSPTALTQFSMTGGGLPAGGQVTTVDVFNTPGNLNGVVLGVAGRQYSYDPILGQVTVTAGATHTTVPIQTGLTFASNSGYGYVIGFVDGVYQANGSPMFPYAASTTGSPASYPLMTAPQMFTFGEAFYTFDVAQNGAWVSVTGDGQTWPIRPYQFSLNGAVYTIDSNRQPYTVSGGGTTVKLTANNTQFVIDGVQYTVTLKAGSLAGATLSGQFNIAQGNVVAIEDYLYLLDAMNGQVVGNGTAYPLTTSGFTYAISTADNSFTVTTEANADTVTIGNVVYRIDGSSVVGDGITYPVLEYRTFVDGGVSYVLGLDGTVTLPQPLAVAAFQFTDGAHTYTVKQNAAFDGASYYLITTPAANAPPQFTTAALTYQLRNDAAAITNGGAKTYLVNTGALSPNQVPFGTKTLFFGRTSDLAAFDGTHYYAIANNQFTDTNTGKVYTLTADTAVCDGNSYEIFSNLGQGAYFEVPSGPTYYVNIAVADFGAPTGDISSVFPMTSGSFTMPLVYTVSVTGSAVTVNALTYGAATPVATVTAVANALTGGEFTDPVTGIVYTCVRQGMQVAFVDSNNVVYPLPLGGGTFTALVPVATSMTVAIDNHVPANVWPVQNNSFTTGATTYNVNVLVAYANAAGPYRPMVAGRFIVPQADPLSDLAYRVSADKSGKGNAVKGYVISEDDVFSPDGKAVYAVNAVNVAKATNEATLAGQTVTLTYDGETLSYTIDATTATIQPNGMTYDSAAKQFKVNYPGGTVTYTVGAGAVTDDRLNQSAFPSTLAGSQLSFTDTVAGARFSFDSSGNNQISASFPYRSQFFLDALNGITFDVDSADNKVEALLTLPETTRYAFSPADGNTYLIHYNAVEVVFPVIAGANVNAGVATVGSDTFAILIDEVEPVAGGGAVSVNFDSFEVNGELYTISAGAVGPNYSACKVVGAGKPPFPFTGPNTFKLSDPAITYTLHLDDDNLPRTISASFPVLPSRDLISVGDELFAITYASTTTGTLRGQGQAAIPITSSAFVLSNPFDTTRAKFIFADADIYNAASVVGQFTVNQIPTFSIGSTSFTLDTVNLVVTDGNRRPYPLVANPMMFSINGFNYLIDTNQTPHTIVGNDNRSPLQTDITVQAGQPIANSTFTLNGQIYAYVEDSQHNLLTIVGTKSYMIAQPALTFKLDSSLLFTLVLGAPGAGNYAGAVAPIAKVTAGTTVLNVYAGTAESGFADFFTYKNVLYTFVKSEGVYVAVQKSYSLYASVPAVGQQQLAVFDMNGTTYLVTDGTTAGDASPRGVNPASIWSATSLNTVESQFGLVYGLGQQAANVIRNGDGTFQFAATDSAGNPTLFDIKYTAGGSTNQIVADVPKLLPSFTQQASFTFLPAYAPLTFETGGYNAFTMAVEETASPVESFSAAWNTPIMSDDAAVASLITPQGDFSVEFWHSIPVTPVAEQSVFNYAGVNSLISYADITFPNTSQITVTVNDTVMQASTTPSTLTTNWRHVCLAYTQPYVMVCSGAPFVVANGSSFNFERDFTMAMTVAASATGATQGLLYKGTGSAIPAPQTKSSFRVTLDAGNHVVLEVANGDGSNGSFTGPALDPGNFYQVLITKHTKTPMAKDDASSDPYSPPFDPNTMMKTPKGPTVVKIGSDNTVPIGPDDSVGATDFEKFASGLSTQSTDTGYIITIAVREMQTDGSFGAWTSMASSLIAAKDAGLLVANTGASNLVIGGAYDDNGNAMPFGAPGKPGNVREVYLFASAFRTAGIRTSQGFVQIEQASYTDLQGAGLVGWWKATYDSNGVVPNKVDSGTFAASSSGTQAVLAPLPHREVEGIALYVNGSPVTLSPVSLNAPSPSGTNSLTFNAGSTYRIQEISFWSMARQAYQAIGDMFGQLIPSNEPFLPLYLPGSFSVDAVGVDVPILPLAKYIESVKVRNLAAFIIDLGTASLDLQGCPAIGRCGPLVSPNLYTPPGIALTVCDTPPRLTTYSVTVNAIGGALAGVLKEAYVFVRNHVLTVYAGKKVGDLALVWVSQEQGDPQIIGYIEGAPPAPMANLTNKSSYAGATSVTFNEPISLTFKYQTNEDGATTNKGSGGASGNYDPASISAPSTSSVTATYRKPTEISDNLTVSTTTTENTPDAIITRTYNDDGQLQKETSSTPPKGAGGNLAFQMGIGPVLAALGFGVKGEKLTVNVGISAGLTISGGSGTGTTTQETATEKLDEGHKYSVRMEGTMTPYTGDGFMANLNSLSVPSATVGTPASKTPILPNPQLGGFTTSNPPGALPKTTVTEERFGQRMFVPSPYGQAFVTSTTVDVYQQILLQTNTTFGFIRVPDPQIPRDLNILSFRMSSRYLRPGVLDGVVGYQYNPARLASGATTWQTTTGQLSPVYDSNFSAGEVGHNASYMRVVEAYQLKKQIDQQAFNAMALYKSTYANQASLPDPTLTPGLDFYNEYVWTARGGTQEVKHTYTTTYEEVLTTTQSSTLDVKVDFNAKVSAGGSQVLGLSGGYEWVQSTTKKFQVTYTGNVQFDVAAAFDGIENDTQMRYAANNDAHFVMNFNSTFNPANQSGLNLVIGSDGLVYNIVPSVKSGAGLPISDNLDTTFTYQQPQPSYATGNAVGLTGNLEPYDRPGKTKGFRSYAFYMQPRGKNADDFWNTVVDSNWLNNSGDPDALALLSAKKANQSVPWRMFYRVTYSERFLPPISTTATVVPQITPVFAVPVLNPVSDFLFQPPGSSVTSLHNPHNDVEANVVLVAPTASGLRIGTVPSSGAGQGIPVLPNNVIPFDIAKNPPSLINWGDTVNTKLLGALTLSITRQNTVPMAAFAPAGSTKVTDVAEPGGSTVYTVYNDPNGITVNVPVVPATVVYQDVNGNPIQYYDGKIYRTLQADYLPTVDGTITYYIQPPSTYDQTVFDLAGDDDLYGNPGDQWRYYLVSGVSSNMTSSESVQSSGPFLNSGEFTAFTIPDTMHDKTTGRRLVEGYVLAQGVMQWPNMNVPAQSFADVQVYKAMSVLDTFPIGDPEVLIRFLRAQYPAAVFVGKMVDGMTVPDNTEIELVFAKNITTYFNTVQQALVPQ
jgi:hypothetical protein